MRKITKPIFKPGDEVFVTVLKKVCTIAAEPKPRHNGFVWMYSFVGEKLSCGEIYLQRP